MSEVWAGLLPGRGLGPSPGGLPLRSRGVFSQPGAYSPGRGLSGRGATSPAGFGAFALLDGPGLTQFRV